MCVLFKRNARHTFYWHTLVLLTSAYTATAAFQIEPHNETQWSKNNAGTCGWLKEFPVVSMLFILFKDRVPFESSME